MQKFFMQKFFMKDNKIILLLLMVLFFFHPPVWGTPPPPGESLRFDVSSKWIGAKFGYFPLFVQVTNLREKASYTIQVRKNTYKMQFVCKKTFRIDPGQSLSFVMNVPLVGRDHSFLIDVVDSGGKVLEELRKNISPNKTTYDEGVFGFLIIQQNSLQIPGWEARREMEDKRGYGIRIRHEHLRSSELPPTWISYTGLSAVLIPLKEFLDLPSEKQRALVQWVGQGGSLCLSGAKEDGYSKKKLQSLFSDLEFSSLGEASVQTLPWFFGHLHLLTSENVLEERTLRSLKGSLDLAFQKDLNGNLLTPNFINAFNEKFKVYLQSYETTIKTQETNAEWRVQNYYQNWIIKKEGSFLKVYQEDLNALEGIIKKDPQFKQMLYDVPRHRWREMGLPATGFCLFLIIFFAFVLIPTSFFILRSQSRLILLYLVVPIFSFVVTSFIFVYSFFAEGVQTKLQSYSVNFLDQEKNTLYGKNAFQIYAPLSPGSLSFSADTAVVVGRLCPIPFSSGNSYDSYSSNSENLSMEWGEGQVFKSGWILPRDQAFWRSLYIRSSRRRILLSAQGETFKVVNSLGVSIQKLGYKYGGKYYLLQGKLSPGQEGLLKPILQYHFEGNFDPAKFYYLSGSLRDGTYLAEVDQWPDQELGLKSYKSLPGNHRLIGTRAFPKGKGN